MKILFYSLLCIMFFNACVIDKTRDTRDIKIINTSDNVIYCIISQNDIIHKLIKDEDLSMFESKYKIEKKSSAYIFDKTKSWDNYIIYSEDSRMRIFIISKDSVDKYGWKELLSKNIYNNVYKLNIDDLNKNNWQIIFNGN